MAGNTKLIGFAGSKVKLKRWGKDVMVEVGKDAVEAIHKACAEDLPRKPLPHHIGMFELSVKYDPTFGQAVIRMNPAVVERFIGYLRHSPEKEGEFLKHHFTDLLAEVEQALEDHKHYTDVDEPGL
jgi:hypothetical protein